MMRDKLLSSKFLGPYLDNYYSKRGMTTPYKLRTCTFMLAGMACSITLVNLLWVQVLVPSIGISAPEMFHSKSMDKPCDNRLLIHTISTTDRIAKWDGALYKDPGKMPYNIVPHKNERIIRFYISA